ncbi:hypothetical protein HBI49_112960 [Parastagonospora nodorum]|nr:hypothetical protein HBI49_112960 [Parastagonospora nodorum]KAH5391040.1 hypothetical protein HBI32_237910 [Parastagonospora nodorum]
MCCTLPQPLPETHPASYTPDQVFKESCYRKTNLAILRVDPDVLVAFHPK